MSIELIEKNDVDFELKDLIENIDVVQSEIDIFSEIIEKQLQI